MRLAGELIVPYIFFFSSTKTKFIHAPQTIKDYLKYTQISQSRGVCANLLNLLKLKVLFHLIRYCILLIKNSFK